MANRMEHTVEAITNAKGQTVTVRTVVESCPTCGTHSAQREVRVRWGSLSPDCALSHAEALRLADALQRAVSAWPQAEAAALGKERP